MANYLVNGTHPHPDYRLQDAIIDVRENSGEGTYYAKHALLGCGKDYKSPEAAIRGLCSANAVSVTKIVKCED